MDEIFDFRIISLYSCRTISVIFKGKFPNSPWPDADLQPTVYSDSYSVVWSHIVSLPPKI